MEMINEISALTDPGDCFDTQHCSPLLKTVTHSQLMIDEPWVLLKGEEGIGHRPPTATEFLIS